MGASSLDRQFATKIIAAHGLWKFRLHDAIVAGRSSFDPAVVGLDDRCPFGQWIYGEGARTAGDDPYFADVKELHATFHRSAAEVLRLAVAGKPIEAEAMMAAGQPFLDVSTRLVGLIDDWRRGTPHSGDRTTVNELLGTAIETVAQADTAARAAELVQSNIVAVAGATEEMTSAITEVAESANKVALMASEAVEATSTAMQTVTQLTDAALAIDHVLGLIESFATQTNLLSLNAAIEAARVGDAGRGFAVVAAEIKQLARQSGEATVDVGRKVGAIRDAAAAAASSIESFAVHARSIADHQTAIAAAVEEQSAATNEISRRIAEAGKAAGEITEIVAAVGLSAHNTELVLNEGRASDGARP